MHTVGSWGKDAKGSVEVFTPDLLKAQPGELESACVCTVMWGHDKMSAFPRGKASGLGHMKRKQERFSIINSFLVKLTRLCCFLAQNSLFCHLKAVIFLTALRSLIANGLLK